MLLNIQFCFWRFFDACGCSYHIVTFYPAEVSSATSQPQSLQFDLRRVNKRNEKVLSTAIHVIFGVPEIGGILREIPSEEHERPCSLLLKAPHT